MISVVIPLYNKEPIIERSLKSVLTQDFDDFEVVIVNDGSTDRSVEIVRGIDDSRITLIDQENGGPSKARNTGVKHAKGEWIVFLDADDELLPNTLDYFNTLIQTYRDIDIIDCNKYFRVKDHIQIGYHPINGYVDNPIKEFYFKKISPGCGNSVFRRTFMLKHLYDERIRRFEDGELLTRQLTNAIVYSTSHFTMTHNIDYNEASRPCNNVYEDYFAYLDFHTGGFWRRMCVYRIFLENRDLYPEFGRKHYRKMYFRYDLLLCHKILNLLKKYL